MGEESEISRFHIGLVIADDLVGAFLIGVLVDHGDRGAKLHLTARHLGDVDHLGARNLVLKFLHAASIQP